MRSALSLGVCALSIALLASCKPGEHRGELAELAAQARAQGKTEVAVSRVLDENGSETPLAQLLETVSVVIAKDLPARRIVTATADDILTWHIFKVDEWLSIAKPLPDVLACHGTLPQGIVLAADEIAVPLLAGSTEIKGVKVTMLGSEASIMFQPDQRYLLLLRPCQEGVARLPQGALDIFTVDSESRIRDAYDVAYPVPFMIEMVQAVQTVDKLALMLRRHMAGNARWFMTVTPTAGR